jgi:hypothetical protein
MKLVDNLDLIDFDKLYRDYEDVPLNESLHVRDRFDSVLLNLQRLEKSPSWEETKSKFLEIVNKYTLIYWENKIPIPVKIKNLKVSGARAVKESSYFKITFTLVNLINNFLISYVLRDPERLADMKLHIKFDKPDNVFKPKKYSIVMDNLIKQKQKHIRELENQIEYYQKIHDFYVQ